MYFSTIGTIPAQHNNKKTYGGLMETKIAVLETKMNNHRDNFEKHVSDYRTLRATFTNVTVGIMALIFGVSAAYVGGVYWTTDKQIALAQQQSELSKQQSALSRQQDDANKEMRAITTQLVKINTSMDTILKDHTRFQR